MSDLLQRLKPKERRGSKPRCHLLTNGSADQVAARLTELATPFGHVSPYDHWMPQGFDDLEEAQLHKVPRLINAEIGKGLREWWLAGYSPNSMTPNFDIASTCTIKGKVSLLLIEAKAYDEELNQETAGKKLAEDASEDSKANHKKIAAAILTARDGLTYATSLKWQISCDSHYQMSNRFAWSWKLTDLGYPVILVYLGFLKAGEMRDKGNPFVNHSDWARLVKEHSEPLFPPEVWGRRWMYNGQPFIPLIKSIEQPLDHEAKV